MKMLRGLASLIVVCYCLGQAASYLVGRGFADVTGLAGEGAMYGYATPSQDARGLHSRQFSRAFVVVDEETQKRAAVVVVEVCMITQAVRTGVVEKLRERLGGGLYDYDNVLLTGTHSHSTPGGFHTYWMYQAPSLGFINETYDATVLGIVESIVRAHDDLRPGKIFYKSGELIDATISRSPYAYDNNPDAEKDSYAYNTEKAMDLLHFVDDEFTSLGMINFFPVHTTSMKRSNHLISTDNKGYAAQMFERQLNPGLTPSNPSILGAFAQSEEGDATPNVRGDWCDDDFFERCTYNTSTCSADPLNPSLCNSYGPTGIDFDDTMTIGHRQFQKALELFNEPLRAQQEVVGRVDFRHQWVNFSDVLISQDGENEVRTCRPAMGYSFAAGATDGPGIKPFTQGMLNPIPIIDAIVKSVYNFSQEYIDCHAPKPILLPTEASWPYPWQPDINAMQLVQIGNIVLIAVPGEFTTMAGRRLRAAVENVLKSPPNNYPSNTKAIIAGISNGYTSYITTWDEYQVQRYEGGSTTYGPNTLKMYEIKMSELANAMAQGVTVDAGLPPPDLRGLQKPALRDVAVDESPDGLNHGDILVDVQSSYTQGTSAKAVFVAGNPRNNHMTGVPFLEVQQLVGADWVTVYDDAYWETRMNWDSNCHDPEFRNSTGEQCFFSQLSNVTITWDIPANQQPGEYRLVHNGVAMLVGGRLRTYTGISSAFTVVTADFSKGKVTRYDHQHSSGYGFERPSPSHYDDGELTEDEAWDVLFQVMLDTPW